MLVGDRAVPVVRARARYDIDRAAGKAAVGDIEWRGLDRNLLDRVNRYRRTLRRIAAVIQAEVVVLTNAVDGEAVESIVRAGDGNSVVIRIVNQNARILLNDVLEIAIDVRLAGNVFRIEVRGSAHLHKHILLRCGYNDFFNLGDSSNQVQNVRLRQRDEDFLNALFAVRA